MLPYHIGAISYFICHGHLTRAAARPVSHDQKPYPSWASEATALKVTRSIGAWVSFLHW